jgi:hypothetical protein
MGGKERPGDLDDGFVGRQDEPLGKDYYEGFVK